MRTPWTGDNGLDKGDLYSPGSDSSLDNGLSSDSRYESTGPGITPNFPVGQGGRTIRQLDRILSA